MGSWARWTVGGGLLVAGVAMLVLPGPGIPTILAGLALLERDVPAVARVTAWLRARVAGVRQLAGA